MLHDLLLRLTEGTEGLEVEDTVLSHLEVRGQIRSGYSHTVVFRRDGPGLPSWAADLLDRHPRLRFISLDPEGRSGDVFELRLVRKRIDEISADALIAALHESAGDLEPLELGTGC